MKMSMISKMLCVGMVALSAAVCGAADLYWVGPGGGVWHNANHWAASSGGAGGEGIPGSGDRAIFDGSVTTDCLIDDTINVRGFSIEAGYSGTITQSAGAEINIGDNGFDQADGTFVGGTTNIVIDANGGFTLSGGNFTAPAATLHIEGGSNANLTIFSYTGGTFNNNGTTLRFERNYGFNADHTYTINVAHDDIEVDHLIFTGGNTSSGRELTYRITGDNSIIVVENVLLQARTDLNANAALLLDGETVEARGDVIIDNFTGGEGIVMMTGSDNAEYVYEGGRGPHLQINKASTAEITAANGTTNLVVEQFSLMGGSFEAPENTMSVGVVRENQPAARTVFDFTGGTFLHNDGTLRFDSAFDMNATRSFTINLQTDDLEVNNLVYTGGNASGNTTRRLRHDIDGGNGFVVLGDLTLEGDVASDPNNKIEPRFGTMTVYGNLDIRDGFYMDDPGSTLITLTGSNDQVVSQTGGLVPGSSFTIDKSGGSVVLATDFDFSGSGRDLIWSAGGLNLSSNTFTVGRHVTISSDATALGVTVADATTAGQLLAGGTVSGIDNVNLEILIEANVSDVMSQSYTILSNNTTLSDEFAWVVWTPPPWDGTISYSENSGQDVTLSEISQPGGTVFFFR